MFYLKVMLKVLFSLCLLAVVCALIAYVAFVSPKERAAAHLEFVHKSVGQMHPAAVDPDAKKFQDWYKAGYEQTKALLPLVHSVADERALLNFYFAGYEESHLGGNFAYSSYNFLDNREEYWAGWVLKATTEGYKVAYSLGGHAYPTVGMQIVSCDNQPIDVFLQKYYAPYLDKRWNIYAARDKAASALSLRADYYPILQRPFISACTFKNEAGEEKIFPFAWIDMTAEVKQTINQLHFHAYIFPAVIQKSESIFWINTSDFQLNSPEAFQHHQQMLSQLKTLKGKETLIFDLRFNGGGNSDFGNEILSAAFGEAGFAYLEARMAEKLGETDALYRPSWPFYWSRDYMISKLKKSQGESSSEVKWLSAINARMKKALDNHEKTFSQSEALSESKQEKVLPQDRSWQFQGNVIVLTDRSCVSSCLDFMDILKQIPRIQHWGEPTNADTVYTEVADMWHDYYKEAYRFIVPVKRWSKRLRKDNEPYIPDLLFEGNIYDDQAVEHWVLEQIRLLN